MRLILQLSIDTSGTISGEPNYERLELFDYETIELTSSLQDVRDIGNVFTDYSQEFTIPASTSNNKALKHFYNTNLIDGFDGRVKKRAIISLNGITFREGYIRLSESLLINNQPSSYSLTFFGQLVNLKQAFGDDYISDLAGLSKYNHEFNNDTVYEGFTVGLGLQGVDMVQSTNADIIYPSISSSDRWYYDSTAPSPPVEYNQGFSVNLFTDNLQDYGINYTQLKPAIKARHIISAIQETYSDYGVTFSEDFFNSVDFNQLYLLMHKSKGIIGSGNGEQSRIYNIGTGDADADFKYNSGDYELRPLKTESLTQAGEIYFEVKISVYNVSPASPKYTLSLIHI